MNKCKCHYKTTCEENSDKTCSHCEQKPIGWEETFKKFYDNNEVGGSSRWLVTPSTVRIFISNLLSSQKQELIHDIRKWTKGKIVTKDKLKEYLNNLNLE